MASFPEEGKKYTMEDLSQKLPDGKHGINLNSVDLTLLVAYGIPYINMGAAAELCGVTPTAHRTRVIKREKETGESLRYDFGGLETWMKLEDVKRLFFTPRTRGPKAAKRIEQEQ